MAENNYTVHLGTLGEKHVKAYDTVSTAISGILRTCEGYTKTSLELLPYLPNLVLSFAKFKKGDRVYLNHTPEISKDSGWMGDRHFLVKGSPAIISGVDCWVSQKVDEGKESVFGEFHYSLVFDHDTYLDLYSNSELVRTVARDEGRKGHYYFVEKSISGEFPGRESIQFQVEVGGKKVDIQTTVSSETFQICARPVAVPAFVLYEVPLV